MQGSETSVLVPQLETSVKPITSWAAVSGVVSRSLPSGPGCGPQLAARAVSPTTSTNSTGLSRLAQAAPGAASGAIVFFTAGLAWASWLKARAREYTTLPGVIR